MQKFRVEFARYTGSKFAITLSNGTVALELALRGLKIGEESDHEVLVTPRSFIASVSCVINVGAKPVFVDLDPVSGIFVLMPSSKPLLKKPKQFWLSMLPVGHVIWTK